MSLEIDGKIIFSIGGTTQKIYSFDFVSFRHDFLEPIEHNREIDDDNFFLDLIAQAVKQG